MTGDRVPVPTVPELAKRGQRWAIAHPGNRYTLTPEGQQLITDAMRENGRRNREESTR